MPSHLSYAAADWTRFQRRLAKINSGDDYRPRFVGPLGDTIEHFGGWAGILADRVPAYDEWMATYMRFAEGYDMADQARRDRDELIESIVDDIHLKARTVAASDPELRHVYTAVAAKLLDPLVINAHVESHRLLVHEYFESFDPPEARSA